MTTAAYPAAPFATGRPSYASDEAPTNDPVQRLVEGTWASIGPRLAQPGVLTGIMVMLLFVVVVWQHPLAKALGTEKTIPPLTPTSLTPVASAAPPNSAAAAASKAGHKLPKTHPRDPFNASMASSGGTAAVGTSPTTTQAVQSTTSGTTTGPATGTGTGTGTGTVVHHHHHGSSGSSPAPAGCSASHVVKPGESLWSIANDRLLGHGFHNVDTAWHALYAKNRSTIGSNPNYLVAGERLCLPS
jgi:hypothetical protein